MKRLGVVLIAASALAVLACIGGFIAAIWTGGELSERITGTVLIVALFIALPLGAACEMARSSGWFDEERER